jgi:hypothetical protein
LPKTKTQINIQVEKKRKPGKQTDIDLRQKCIHLRHNLFAPILLLCHLFVQAMDIICANKIDIHLRTDT